jgi:putative CocE/NonD family hydrolase
MASAETGEPVVERDVSVRMRDGVTLYADIYRPTTAGKFPVLLMRTPYGKSEARTPSETAFYPPHGYIVVVQDTRGRFKSKGEFYPYFNEAKDGYDTIEWAARLPGSDGQVAMVGQSYSGLVQYLAAKERPPSLKAMCPVSGPITHLMNCTYRGGAFELGWMLTYFISMMRNTLERDGLWEERKAQIENYLARPELPNSLPSKEAYRRLPLKAWGDDLRVGAPHFKDILTHYGQDEFWEPVDLRPDLHKIDIPMFHVGSWYDAFQYDTLMMFAGLRASAASRNARRGQKLLMGPWGHLIPFNVPTSKGTGDIDFGPEARIDLNAVQLRWLDHVLKGKENGTETETPVRIFVMGRNVWRDEQEWPLSRAEYKNLYLHSGGRANSLEGDGTLSFAPPGEEPVDHYSYDPDDPVPTRGGAGLARALGAFDQREIEKRNDVLVFTSAPLEQDLEVTGPVQAVLHVESSAPDTDFTAKLVDVCSDGYAQNIVDGIIRARYRHGLDRPEMLAPGQMYELTIDLWSTSHVFAAGHRLRVEISSSNFPRYDRNLNTAEEFGEGVTWAIARQSVHHDRTHPSRLILPVIPG